jgi:hypothetical protein
MELEAIIQERQRILGLEIMKEEKDSIINEVEVDSRNELRKSIISLINQL